jgi:excisionase family DNA binding protein
MKVYTVPEVMELTRMGRTAIYAHIKQGTLKCVRIGGRTLFREDQIAEFLSKDQPTPPRT